MGRPFLADHNIRLELSQEKGEVLSYQMDTGDRLCIPICSPESPGWEMYPPKRTTGHFLLQRQVKKDKPTQESQEDSGNTNKEGPMEWKEYPVRKSYGFRRTDKEYQQKPKGKSRELNEEHNLPNPGFFRKPSGNQDITENLKLNTIQENPGITSKPESAQGKENTVRKVYHLARMNKRSMEQAQEELQELERGHTNEEIPVKEKNLDKKGFKNYSSWQYLQELPGGGTLDLDFVELLNTQGTNFYFKQNQWKSRCGWIQPKLRSKHSQQGIQNKRYLKGKQTNHFISTQQDPLGTG